MAKSTIKEGHELTQKEAYGQIKNVYNDALKQHGDKIKNLTQNWDDKNYKGSSKFTVNVIVKGINISGNLSGEVQVNEKDVIFTVEYPATALPLVPIVENMLRKEAKTRLKRK